MGINFSNPWVLLLILPIMGFIVFSYTRTLRNRSQNERWAMITRSIIIILLILSLAGVSIRKSTDKTTLIFAVDLSDSTKDARESMVSFIRKTLQHKPSNYQIGIITFGKSAVVEQPLSYDMAFHGLETIPEPHFTDISAGLQMARALMPEDTQKRVLLLTDGNENLGEAVQKAKSLSLQGVRVDGVFFNSNTDNEVQISSLDLPSKLYQNEAYDIRVTIDSSINTSGNIRLYANRKLVAEQKVEIQKGENRFIFRDVADESGIKTYEAELDVEDDSIKQNNRMASYVEVQGPPLLAMVEGKEGESRELAAILDAAGIKYNIYDPLSFPEEIDELRKYHGIVLCNTSADDLGMERINILNTYVKSLGRGLLFTGGDNSYALGGYMGTSLADMLPVDLDLSRKAEIPDLGLVLVIDKSGSMADGQYGITKIDMAKEAALRSIESLRPVDYIGVVAFDGDAHWIVNTQHPENLDAIEEQILSIPARGGTNIYPGLLQAYDSLKGLNTKLKHVILMTDGQSMPGDYYGILEKMGDQGITLSTVAVGQDADQSLLEGLATQGEGRYYYTDEFADIPKIFTKETYMATQSYIQNRTFFPIITGHSPMVNAFTEGFPALHGYIATLPKNAAIMVLSSDRQDPILAEWQYGLGRVIAWTSDVRGIWTEDWLKWNKAEDFWLGAISRLLPLENDSQGFIDTSLVGDQGRIRVSLGEIMMGNLESEAIVIDPAGKENKVDLKVIQPGIYEGNFSVSTPGIYIINTRHKDGGQTTITSESALAVSYSSEYDLRQSGSKEILHRIVNQTGGKIFDNPEDVFKENLKPVWAQTEIWPWLLPIALLLFILDIAIRRLNIGSLFKQFIPVHEVVEKTHDIQQLIKVQKAKRIKDVGKDNHQKGKQVKTGEEKNHQNIHGEASDFTSQLLRARKGDRRKRL